MSRENRKSLGYTIKHRDSEGIGISQKIRQKESQKIEYILPILDYLIEHKEFYASELKQKFNDFDDKSVDRTILQLQERGLINLNRIEIKNKKVFRRKSLKQIKIYRNDLAKYSKFKLMARVLQKMNQVKKIEEFASIGIRFNEMFRKGQQTNQHYASLPENFTEPLYIEDKTLYAKTSVASTKKWPELISINEMPSSVVINIMEDYREGYICQECFKQNQLCYCENRDFVWACKNGHVSSLSFYEIMPYTENEELDLEKIGKILTDKGFRSQKRKFLLEE
jgi:hypothetical protein